jgi:hypothetical protein
VRCAHCAPLCAAHTARRPTRQAYYTFWLPVACGLLLAGESRPEALDLARGICVDIGQYFQVLRPAL